MAAANALMLLMCGLSVFHGLNGQGKVENIRGYVYFVLGFFFDEVLELEGVLQESLLAALAGG